MDWEDFYDYLKCVFIPIFLLVLSIILLIYFFRKYECYDYQEITGKETKHTLASCYVKTDDGFQRWDEYKNRSVGKDSLKEMLK